jgi:cell division protein FtsI (penicillin-binding protein 3)
MLGRTDSRARMVLVMLAFAVVAVAAAVRLGQWQIVQAEDLSANFQAGVAAAQAAAIRTVRADIVDRDGKILAKTSSFDQVVAYPDLIASDEVEDVVATLGALLDLKPREQERHLKTITAAKAGNDKFVSLERKISLEQSELVLDAIEDDLLDGIGLEANDVRFYPRKGGEPGTSLASQLLGFVRADGRGGGASVEAYYHERLVTPDPSLVDVATTDSTAIELAGLDPEPLELTIDAKLQKQVEAELTTAYQANQAKSVSAIVMDPKTGAILAAASVPGYHAEDFAAIANENPGRLRNRVLSDQYEPGSVMKIFTATAALDLGVVDPNTIVADQVQLRFFDDVVENADGRSEGRKKVKDVIAMSRNVATAKIARKLGSTVQKAGRRLYKTWDRVGLVGKTGVDISGEAAGMPYDPNRYRWAAVDLANRAFGQGASFTLPQLARGMSALVNGGFRVQPHVVADSEQAQVQPERVLRAKTAKQAKNILRHVTGSRAHYAKGSLIPGYDIGGKTGTAQIWNVKKMKWKEKRFNHSFVGFVGGRKQEYVIAVRLEEPVPIYVKRGRIPLHLESYEVFQMVARATIDKLDMKKSKRAGAGLPIIGTDAAKKLTPVRNRQAKQEAKREARQEAKKQVDQAKAAKAAPGKRADDGPDLAADKEAASRASGGGST